MCHKLSSISSEVFYLEMTVGFEKVLISSIPIKLIGLVFGWT